jgi:hypothetical protein
MTIQWTGFPSSVVAGSTDILVGLAGGTANARFNASSFLFSANNLSDLTDLSSAQTNLGLGQAALENNNFFLQVSNNLIDLANTATARVNLGVGASGTHADSFFLQTANNLSDLASLPTALTNLGLSSSNNVTFASITTTGLNISSNANNLTAFAGGGQSSAIALTKAFNRVTTVATTGDSVKLPAALAGESVVVINAASSNALNCFPASGDAINALSANTAISIAANSKLTFVCAVNGTWNS